MIIEVLGEQHFTKSLTFSLNPSGFRLGVNNSAAVFIKNSRLNILRMRNERNIKLLYQFCAYNINKATV